MQSAAAGCRGGGGGGYSTFTTIGLSRDTRGPMSEMTMGTTTRTALMMAAQNTGILPRMLNVHTKRIAIAATIMIMMSASVQRDFFCVLFCFCNVSGCCSCICADMLQSLLSNVSLNVAVIIA